MIFTLLVGLVVTKGRSVTSKIQKNSRHFSTVGKILGMGLLAFFIAYIIVQSVIIALPFGLIAMVTPLIFQNRRKVKAQLALQTSWPEILDNLISGLQGGLSLAETLVTLGYRGPEVTKPAFLTFQQEILRSGDFPIALHGVKSFFNDHVADQVCEVLQFSKSSGSRDTALTLRLLSDFIRTDIAIRCEIAAKHSWIKNSATLGACAPWILLLILASQPNTVKAYESGPGIGILLVGVALTCVAYFWMHSVSEIRKTPRAFAT
jgi:tight adherence protein B